MINLEWVKDYIDISDEDLKELAVKITKAGINVEAVISRHIDNLVIGKVTKVEKHPGSDHLHICEVDIGEETLQIVCGAPNVKKGLKVIVAKIGAILPGDFEIKESKIRGITSKGMLCALFELGLEPKNDENYNKGIHELPKDAPVGEDPLKYMGVDDTLYELDIHKHRNNDCYYHIGFAYEIAAILNKNVHLPETNYDVTKDNVNDKVKLRVETTKCPYYLGKMVTGVKIGETPDFIKKRLNSVGIRSINNVVDISNYVMLEFGQPLHFFDKDKLGDEIIVRDAEDEEKIVTLDGKERVLNSNDIVIADKEKAICVAGVMGGENTEVTDKTKNIFIEAAIFDPVSIRYTASKLDLKSEASIRYGKGLSYDYTEKALDRACNLLEKYAGAKILNDYVVYDQIDREEKIVTFETNELNKMLGLSMTDIDVEKQLNRLDFPYLLKENKFTVTIPKRRLDIDPNINDIAEEIGRLYGYHNLVSTLPNVPIRKGGYIGDVKYRKTISKRLRTLGLNETKTYTLVSPEMASLFRYEDKEMIDLPNPMSMDKSVLRTSLIPSLLNVYEYNKARKLDNIMLYEISKTYDKEYNEDIKICVLMEGIYLYNNWQNNNIKVDFYVIKGILENLLNFLGFNNRYTLQVEEIKDMHPGISAKVYLDKEPIGIIGRVHPSIKKDDIYVLELSMTKLMKSIKPIKYKEPSKYPEIKKDVAFAISKNVTCEELEKVIKKAGGRLLTNIDVFDVYTGENLFADQKSIAFSLTFSDSTRTLTDEEVTEVFNNIISSVEEKCDATLRNK